MSNLARKLHHDAVFMEAGTITRREGAAFSVRTEGGELIAKRAASCLLEPQVGDRVLCAAPQGDCYVLAVLEREEGAASRVVVDGDLEIRVPHGRFSVGSQEGIDLAAAKEVSVVSAALNINAVDGNVLLKRLSFLGTAVRAEVEKVRLVAGSFDSVLERLSHKVKRAYRFVEELDQVRASQIDYAADKNVSIRGENTIMTAKELVKVDGEQIHIG